MNYVKGKQIYEGKAKQIFEVENQQDLVWMDFKNSLTAFNGVKKGGFDSKGEINLQITSLIFKYLAHKGHATHFVALTGPHSMVSKKVKVIPLEVVVRNVLAGSTAKKLGIAEGTALEKPLVEFYYKDDALNDPFISDEQAMMLKVVNNQGELEQLKKMALQINQDLIMFFAKIGLDLVDFKLEFGKTSSGDLLLADEISPDSCRLWDQQTHEKMDKDRFRRDLGKVEETYREVLQRMKNVWENAL